MKIRMTATGTRPLLMHNEQLASPFNRYAKELQSLTDKKKKTVADRMEMARIQFEGGLYFSADIGPFIPAACVFASLVAGARLTKAGKRVERGVVVANLEMPLIYQGPRTVPELWSNGESEFVDLRSVKVGLRSKIDRCRPIFRKWAFEADIFLDTGQISPDEFYGVARDAGAFEGIGDYRRMYGRYEVDVIEL